MPFDAMMLQAAAIEWLMDERCDCCGLPPEVVRQWRGEDLIRDGNWTLTVTCPKRTTHRVSIGLVEIMAGSRHIYAHVELLVRKLRAAGYSQHVPTDHWDGLSETWGLGDELLQDARQVGELRLT